MASGSRAPIVCTVSMNWASFPPTSIAAPAGPGSARTSRTSALRRVRLAGEGARDGQALPAGGTECRVAGRDLGAVGERAGAARDGRHARQPRQVARVGGERAGRDRCRW